MNRYHLRRAIGAISLSAFVAASALPLLAHDGHHHAGPTAPVGHGTTSAVPEKREPDLAEVRKRTERFRDVNVALAEGYIRDPGDLCETAEMMGQPAALGAMGIHFFRPDLGSAQDLCPIIRLARTDQKPSRCGLAD